MRRAQQEDLEKRKREMTEEARRRFENLTGIPARERWVHVPVLAGKTESFV